MADNLTIFSEFSIRSSQFLHNLRSLSNQANDRSIIHLLEIGLNALFFSSFLVTTSIKYPNLFFTSSMILKSYFRFLSLKFKVFYKQPLIVNNVCWMFFLKLLLKFNCLYINKLCEVIVANKLRVAFIGPCIFFKFNF